MGDLTQDIRYAIRSLRRAPAFAVVAVLTLALGIGANVAVFALVDGILLRALPYPRAEQLVSLDASTLGEYQRVAELSHAYTQLAAYMLASINLSGESEPERADAAQVTANLFRTL